MGSARALGSRRTSRAARSISARLRAAVAWSIQPDWTARFTATRACSWTGSIRFSAAAAEPAARRPAKATAIQATPFMPCNRLSTFSSMSRRAIIVAPLPAGARVESARDGDDTHPPRPAGPRRRGGGRSRTLRARAARPLVAAARRARRRRDPRLPEHARRRAGRTARRRSTYMGQPLGAGHSQVQALNTNPSSAKTIITSDAVVRRIARKAGMTGGPAPQRHLGDGGAGIQREAEPDAVDRRSR